MKKYEKPQANMVIFKSRSNTNANQLDNANYASTIENTGSMNYSNISNAKDLINSAS